MTGYLFFTLIISLNGQTQSFKGRKSIGLQLGYSKINTEGGVGLFSGRSPEIGTSYSFSPGFTYFLSNRWRIGGGVSFAKADRKLYPNHPSLEEVNNATTYGIELLTAYHHWFSKKLSFIIEPSLGYSQTNQEGSGDGFSSSGNHKSFFLDTSVGVLFLVNNKFGIDLSTPLLRLTYNSQTLDTERPGNPTYTYDNNELTFVFLGGSALSVLSNVMIGVKYFF